MFIRRAKSSVKTFNSVKSALTPVLARPSSLSLRKTKTVLESQSIRAISGCTSALISTTTSTSTSTSTSSTSISVSTRQDGLSLFSDNQYPSSPSLPSIVTRQYTPRKSKPGVSLKTENETEGLEIKDPTVIFNRALTEVRDEMGGRDQLKFPKEIIWLGGAPGAGKGTNTPFILESRGFLNEPLVMSSLLDSDEFKAIKERGGMVNDFMVVKLLLKNLLKEENRRGVLVDGFPRTRVQIHCIKLLHDTMKNLRQEFFETSERNEFARPSFRVVVLFVEEDESLRRQLSRGQKAIEHNKKVEQTGVGTIEEIRATDNDPEKAKARYQVFKDHYDTLQELNSLFPFHLINAGGKLEQVEQEIMGELRYQSTLELGQDTFDKLQSVPLATELVAYARQDLISRLENYSSGHPALFSKVVETIKTKFFPTIRRHTVTGDAIIRSQDRLWENPVAVDMAVDVLAERGFKAMADNQTRMIPDMIDPSTSKILLNEETTWEFRIRFEGAHIRTE